MTPLQVATDLCKPYALRGDDFNHYRKSYHGQASDKYYACVSGYIGEKHFDTHYIVVHKIDNKIVDIAVKTIDAWNNALREQLTLI